MVLTSKGDAQGTTQNFVEIKDLFDFKEDRLPYLVRKAVEGGELSLSRGAEILKLRSREMRQLASSWVD